jgi:hypothetical protein
MSALMTITRYLQQHPEIALLFVVAILAGWFFPTYDEKLDSNHRSEISKVKSV